MSHKTRNKNRVKGSIRRKKPAPAKKDIATDLSQVSAANSPRSIRILKADYEEKRDLVLWDVEDIKTGDKRVLAHLGKELHLAIGLKDPLTPDLIRCFCKELEGKTKQLVMQASFQEIPMPGKDSTQEELQSMHDGIDQYPYREVAEHIAEQEDEGQNIRQ